MAAHAEKLEDQHGEAEHVVVRCADDLAVAGQPLHLGRLVRADAHFARPAAGALRHLHGVGVDEADGGVLGDEQVAVVDVADHQASSVHGGERAGDVAGGVDQEPPIGLGELPQA